MDYGLILLKYLAWDHATIVNDGLWALLARVEDLGRLGLANEVDLDVAIVNDKSFAHFVSNKKYNLKLVKGERSVV